jgi:hypothetical protein
MFDNGTMEEPMKEDELSTLYGKWSTEDLIRASTVKRDEYMQESMLLIEAELRKRDVPLGDQEQIEQKVVSEERSREVSFTGVRGWLIVFCLVVLFNSVFMVLKGIVELSQAGETITLMLVVPEPLLGVYGLFVLFLLLRRRKTALVHASRWLISCFIYSLLFVIALSLIAGKLILTGILGTTLFALVWLTYIANSKRVAYTYGKTL